MRIISLDVGTKRIGVAKADSTTRIAIPVGYLTVDGSEWQEIARLARLNNTNLFILGLPRSNNGNETKQSKYVRKFATELKQHIPEAKISFQDESLTSVEAEERLKARKKPYEKGEIDAEAATIILQDFLEKIGNKTTDVGEQAGTVNTEVENGKKKSKKKAVRIITVVIILIILALVATAVLLWIKDQRAKERAEYYAEIEAQDKAEVFNFTILPGENIFSVKKKLAEVGYSSEEIEEAFAANYDYEFLKDRPEGASLEGYLFGETHEFYKESTVKEVLETFLNGMEQVIRDNDLANKYAARGLSLYQGITLASVVQKEAPSPEQPTVAQVFLTRLSRGIPLGSDVTVSYALDVVDPNRQTYTDNQAALKVDSCYNTRLYAGLPCGPIANPGLSALVAVANPSDTAYLYFLTGDDGKMYYSYTESEHNQNIYRYCRELCNVAL